MEESTPLYFAFGSNLSIVRLAARIGPFGVMGKARMEGRSLRYHKRGADGSGKADCYATGAAKDVVLGVVYELTHEQKNVLDEIEGVGKGYREARATVPLEIVGGTRDVIVSFYEALPEAIDPELVPFDWYLAYIRQGAREHGLAPEYVAQMDGQAAKEDPNTARAHDNWERLRGRES